MFEDEPQKLLEKLRASLSFSELHHTLVQLCEYYDIGKFTLLACDLRKDSLNVELITSFPKGFIERYLQNNYHPRDYLFSKVSL